MAEKRLFGTIEECFYDYANKHPGLGHLELLVELCKMSSPKVTLEIVQRWQRREYFPGGVEQLAVGCFLHLLGYEVEELNRLDGTIRQAALLVGCDVAKPEAVRRVVPLRNMQSLWRILIHGEGTSKTGYDNLAALVSKKETALRRKITGWKKRIAEVFPEAEQPERTEAILSFAPEMATAFGRSVGTTIALARILINADESRAAQDATSGGSDMHELVTLLQQLST